MRCNIELPRTNLHKYKDNVVERMFWGKIPIVRGTSYFYYRKGSDYKPILYHLKYWGGKNVGEIMGRYMAAELYPSGFFDGVDVMVPVPLHEKKQRSRGYNQSECLALGISAITGIPIDTESVLRIKNTDTQTKKTVYERSRNVDQIFVLRCPERFEGKHVLIIDDVLTTGATTTACGSAFAEVADMRISILTLALAGY